MPNESLFPLKNVLGMDNEPRNEAGVIILFTLKMKQLGFSGVVQTQGRFPDCVARRRGEKVILDFEYKSRAFKTHGHLNDIGRRKCTIICWEDNWQNPPKYMEIISLSRELGL